MKAGKISILVILLSLFVGLDLSGAAEVRLAWGRNKEPIVIGLDFMDNTPDVGSVSWQEHTLQSGDNIYTIAAGNTDKKYIYWKDFANEYSNSYRHPVNSGEWDPVEDYLVALNVDGEIIWTRDNLAGYKLYYGKASEDYQYSIDIQNTVQCTLTDLIAGISYYMIVVAYNEAYVESDGSDELIINISNGSSGRVIDNNACIQIGEKWRNSSFYYFDDYLINPYSSLDNGTYETQNDGVDLRLRDKSWKEMTIPLYSVTENTVLGFYFRSDREGLTHAIGVANQIYTLYGSEILENSEYNNYSDYAPEWRYYKIPIGADLVGVTLNSIVFINDNGENDYGQSIFGNVALYEYERNVVKSYTSDYIYTTAGNGGKKAEFIFNNEPPGEYEIFVRYIEGSDRATDAPYMIYDGDTPIDTVKINQTVNGDQFNLIGTYTFAGIPKVVLTDDANGIVVADAIKIMEVEILCGIPDFDCDGDVDGSDLTVFAVDYGRADCSDCISDCRADFDCDGDVDGSDLTVFATFFGLTTSVGEYNILADLNLDLVINFADLAILKANFFRDDCLEENSDCRGDIDRDGYVNFADLAIMRASFFTQHDPNTANNVIALYKFNEGGGDIIYDSSGYLTPLNLTIQDADQVIWTDHLRVIGSTIIESEMAATKIVEACKVTNEITVEAWIEPYSDTQTGPARIITLSEDAGYRNFTFGQENFQYAFRLRTTGADTLWNGTPTFYTPDDWCDTDYTHIVYTRNSSGEEKIYVNGWLAASNQRDGGFTEWDDTYFFALANELTLDRPWLGSFFLVAIQNIASTEDEVIRNYQAGHDSW